MISADAVVMPIAFLPSLVLPHAEWDRLPYVGAQTQATGTYRRQDAYTTQNLNGTAFLPSPLKATEIVGGLL